MVCKYVNPLVSRPADWLDPQIDRSGFFDVAPQPSVDRFPIEISGNHESDDELVMLDGATSQLETVHPKMHIGGGDRRSLVPIEERVVLNDALQECRCLGYGVVVVARLRSKHSRFKGSEVTNTVGAAELVDEQFVDGEDLNDCEVFGQLFREFFVQAAMPGDRGLGMGNDLRPRRTALLPFHPLDERLIENGLELATLRSGQIPDLRQKFGPRLGREFLHCHGAIMIHHDMT